MKTKSDLPIEELDKMVSDIEIEKGHKVCGYPSLLEDGTTAICRNPAGKETDHLGFGNCKCHGGRGRGKSAGGLYAKYVQMQPTVIERFKEFWDDEDIKKLDSEIILLRTMVSTRIENPTTWDNNKFDFAILRIVDLIGRTIEKKVKIEEGEKYTITVEGLQNFILQIVSIIKAEVPDTETQIRLLRRIQTEVKV